MIVQKERLKKLPSSHKPTKKCGMKMKEEDEERKNDYRVNFCGESKDFVRLYQKTGWIDFDELQVIDSSNNEGTNSLVNG